MHELISHVPRFLAKHRTFGYLNEEEGESLHSSINKELGQYESIRNEGEKLVHNVKNQELLNTADRNLAKVTPRPKCDLCSVYLQKGVCRSSSSKKHRRISRKWGIWCTFIGTNRNFYKSLQ